MPTIAELKSQLDASQESYWEQPARVEAVDKLQRLLGLPVSAGFREFLLTCGGGGAIGQEISGILDGDPAKEGKCSVYGDTLRCREEFGLPRQYVVVFFDEDVEVVWCLDTSAMVNGECPVVSWEPFERKSYPLYPSFAAFFEDYVKLRLED